MLSSCLGLIFIVWILSHQLLFSDAGQLSVSDFSLWLAIGPEPMEISTTSTSQIVELTSCDVTILEGHTSEVCYFLNFSCLQFYYLVLYFSHISPGDFLLCRSVLVHGARQVHSLHQGGSSCFRTCIGVTCLSYI